MDLGYIRLPACKSQQDLDKGIAHLEQAGNLPKSSISLDRSDGQNPDRKELQNILRALHPGDVLHILSLEHLANNIEDLQRIIKKIRDKTPINVFFASCASRSKCYGRAAYFIRNCFNVTELCIHNPMHSIQR